MYKQNSLLNLNKNSGFFQTQSSIRVFGAKNRGDFDTILVSGPTYESIEDGKIKTIHVSELKLKKKKLNGR